MVSDLCCQYCQLLFGFLPWHQMLTNLRCHYRQFFFVFFNLPANGEYFVLSRWLIFFSFFTLASTCVPIFVWFLTLASNGALRSFKRSFIGVWSQIQSGWDGDNLSLAILVVVWHFWMDLKEAQWFNCKNRELVSNHPVVEFTLYWEGEIGFTDVWYVHNSLVRINAF